VHKVCWKNPKNASFSSPLSTISANFHHFIAINPRTYHESMSVHTCACTTARGNDEMIRVYINSVSHHKKQQHYGWLSLIRINTSRMCALFPLARKYTSEHTYDCVCGRERAKRRENVHAHSSRCPHIPFSNPYTHSLFTLLLLLLLLPPYLVRIFHVHPLAGLFSSYHWCCRCCCYWWALVRLTRKRACVSVLVRREENFRKTRVCVCVCGWKI
jgi:hypothetical protein